MKRKSLIILLILFIVSVGTSSLLYMNNRKGKDELENKNYRKEKNEFENKNSEQNEGNSYTSGNGAKYYYKKTKELTLRDFDFLRQGMSLREIIDRIKQPYSIGGNGTINTNYSQINYDLIDGQISLIFFPNSTLCTYYYKTDEELGRQGMRKNLRLDDFDFLKKGMTITEVEEIVGKPHFHSEKGYMKDAYPLDWEAALIVLDYGPERDALRSAKVINRKNDDVNNFPLKDWVTGRHGDGSHVLTRKSISNTIHIGWL